MTTDVNTNACLKKIDDFTSDLEIRAVIDETRVALSEAPERSKEWEALNAQLTLLYNKLGHGNNPIFNGVSMSR